MVRIRWKDVGVLGGVMQVGIRILGIEGFESVNGVNRGGAYDNTNHAQYTRICYRQPRERRGLAMWVGFL